MRGISWVTARATARRCGCVSGSARGDGRVRTSCADLADGRRRCEGRSVPPVYARDVAQRVDGTVVDPQLEVQVRSGGSARAPHVADRVAARDMLPRLHHELPEVAVAG